MIITLKIANRMDQPMMVLSSLATGQPIDANGSLEMVFSLTGDAAEIDLILEPHEPRPAAA